MRWHRIRPWLRLVLSAFALTSLLSLGLAAPRAPSADEVRLAAYALAGGSIAEICGDSGHAADPARCQQCCLTAAGPTPAMSRVATRRVRRPHEGRAALPAPRRPVRRDRARAVRAPPPLG